MLAHKTAFSLNYSGFSKEVGILVKKRIVHLLGRSVWVRIPPNTQILIRATKRKKNPFFFLLEIWSFTFE